MKKGKLIKSGTAEELEDEIAGTVYELFITQEELPAFKSKYVIANLVSYQNKVKVRVIASSDSFPKTNLVRPNLEDLYLTHFEEERGM